MAFIVIIGTIIKMLMINVTSSCKSFKTLIRIYLVYWDKLGFNLFFYIN